MYSNFRTTLLIGEHGLNDVGLSLSSLLGNCTFFLLIMNTTNISVPLGDCILSVFHNRRTVSMLRTGKKGVMLSGVTENNNKMHYPEFERGWNKIAHTSINVLKVYINGGNPSYGTRKELEMETDSRKAITFNEGAIGFCHDLAYEISRSHGSHTLAWTLKNVQTGETLFATAEWIDGKLRFKFSNNDE